MVKYTEEQLIEIKPEAYTPQPEILDEFNKLVESVTLEFAEKGARRNHNGDSFIDEHGNERTYNYLNRRRGSRSGARPLKKKAQEVEVDDDGWATLTKHKKSFSDEAVDERDQFREAVRSEPTKVKISNKKMGSSKAVDSRDTVADKHTNTFNAFEALDD
ncbi:p20 [Yamadazyma tenuis]|uniref:Cap-associated protein CAF20 n=1 Tax=Candida tenuis (strain ATCC 10573 / BCRC 21748 / CBS 615 / JCM 9827 / NBRC 10315 / NRRL Y-1498 / VKM Y-70) TaxID=590646 RepID=G3BER7_CANTC|nr:uncharacterized protein CANTEDRAFT_111701 [Yamadazyma tenuis ATCC 10573]EGV60576.1 hypothetical protein CANTEDRAFT_111701 [Yamadazyma tenuis ATCC 10573]WEJ94176.1 p20 [Yamadazyma tenuis]